MRRAIQYLRLTTNFEIIENVNIGSKELHSICTTDNKITAGCNVGHGEGCATIVLILNRTTVCTKEFHKVATWKVGRTNNQTARIVCLNIDKREAVVGGFAQIECRAFGKCQACATLPVSIHHNGVVANVRANGYSCGGCRYKIGGGGGHVHYCAVGIEIAIGINGLEFHTIVFIDSRTCFKNWVVAHFSGCPAQWVVPFVMAAAFGFCKN